MLRIFKDLFDSFTGEDSRSPAARHHALQLATAVLLVEVMRADPEITTAERAALMTGLREKFTLTETELADLVRQAEQESKSAYDYHQFTSLINEHCSQPQKIRIIESMWQVAYADTHVNADENHIISRIAGLLHVTHGDYIAAKMYAKETAARA